MKKQVSCRQARREMQNVLDRSDPVFTVDREDQTKFLPGDVQAHLAQCPACRDFLHSLGTFAAVLRGQLDESLEGYPDPDFSAVLQGSTGQAAQIPSPRAQRSQAIAAVFQRFRSWLFAPAGKSAAVYRWAGVSVIALVLASFIGVRIYSTARTHRTIQDQIDRVVELVYQEPLLPGIESALVRSRPTISDYMNDLNRSVDFWLEDTDSEPYLN